MKELLENWQKFLEEDEIDLLTEVAPQPGVRGGPVDQQQFRQDRQDAESLTGRKAAAVSNWQRNRQDYISPRQERENERNRDYSQTGPDAPEYAREYQQSRNTGWRGGPRARDQAAARKRQARVQARDQGRAERAEKEISRSQAQAQRRADREDARTARDRDYGSNSMWGSSAIGQTMRKEVDRWTDADRTNRGQAARDAMGQERAWWRPEGRETRFSQDQIEWMGQNPNLTSHLMVHQDASGTPGEEGYEPAQAVAIARDPESHAPLASSYRSGFWNRLGQALNPWDQRSKDTRMHRNIQQISQNQLALQRASAQHGLTPQEMMRGTTDRENWNRQWKARSQMPGPPAQPPTPHRDDELQEIKSFLNSWEQFAARDLVQEEVEPSDVDVSSFKINETLEPNVWQEDQTLNPTVRRRLLHIADKFWQSLDLPGLKIDDVTFTGSLANYNWSQFSDVDLHILVDFRDLPGIDELTEALMTAKRVNWNNKHNIEIFGFEVEIYIQDSNETHHSTGVYSVLHDRWEVRPQYEDFTIDYDNVKIKAAHIMNQIDKIEKGFEAGNYKESISDVDRLKEKLRKFRKCGLEQGGEYSPENLAFKALRRNGYLAKLSKFKIDSYDKIMSL